MGHHQDHRARTDRVRGPRGSRRRPIAAVLALVIGGSVLLGCSSKSDGAAPTSPTTTTSAADTAAQKAAMDATEEELAGIRLPGAIGVFSETVQACLKTQFPQATRTDRSSLEPAELVRQLTAQLEAAGWAADGEEDGRETYWKDPHQLTVEVKKADDGGSEATLDVTAPKTNCA